MKNAVILLALALVVLTRAAASGIAAPSPDHSGSASHGGPPAWTDPYPTAPTDNDPEFVGEKWHPGPMVDGNVLEYLARVPRGDTTGMTVIVLGGGGGTRWTRDSPAERSSSSSARALTPPPTMVGCLTSWKIAGAQAARRIVRLGCSFRRRTFATSSPTSPGMCASPTTACRCSQTPTPGTTSIARLIRSSSRISPESRTGFMPNGSRRPARRWPSPPLRHRASSSRGEDATPRSVPPWIA